MSPHSVLFSSIVDRDVGVGVDVGVVGVGGGRNGTTRKRSPPSPYWSPSATDLPSPPLRPPTRSDSSGGYPAYPPYRADDPSIDTGAGVGTLALPPIRDHYDPPRHSPPHHNSHSSHSSHNGANPAAGIDFSGLIPMYGDAPPPSASSASSASHPSAHEHQHPGYRAPQLLDLSYNHHPWPPHPAPPSHSHQYKSPSSPALWQTTPDGQIAAHQQHQPSWRDGGYALGPYSPPPPPSSPHGGHGGHQQTQYFLPPPPPPPASSSGAPVRRGGGGAGGAAKKSCFHCHVTSTPLWRREPQTQRPLCNACGLYLQQRQKLRPQELIDADLPDDPSNPDPTNSNPLSPNYVPDSEYTGPKCSHCGTRSTSVWRRSKEGRQVCNACGVYARLRGKERPLSLRRNKIKPRTKHTKVVR
ncbi:hypothetical protein C8R46DRAFT_1137386 [Mycena filopes]|nr:hypothetical protein C8R46DRAFT_1137386 [Mycena filopes]